MKNRKLWLVTVTIILILGVGGKLYMDIREKEELRIIQSDLANYLYNNYRLYMFEKEELEKLDKEYDNGKMVFSEYSKRIDKIVKYSDIEKIEFTGFSVGPMKNLKVQYTINDVVNKETSLDTVSAETNKLMYRIGEHDGDGPYYLEKKKEQTTNSIPRESIIYYKGGIN